MDNSYKVKLIRKIIRRDKSFFSGCVDLYYIRFDYQIYGMSYSNSNYYHSHVFKLNVKVSNIERCNWDGNFKPPVISGRGDMIRLNRQVRNGIKYQWGNFFESMFDIDIWNFHVGGVKHLNLRRY